MARLSDHLGTVSGPFRLRTAWARLLPTCVRATRSGKRPDMPLDTTSHHATQPQHHIDPVNWAMPTSLAAFPVRWPRILGKLVQVVLLDMTLPRRQRARSGNRPPAPTILQTHKHITFSPRAGSREDYLLLDSRRMELYYHYYEHSNLIPGLRTRAYDWCLSNMGLGFMVFFSPWIGTVFSSLFS